MGTEGVFKRICIATVWIGRHHQANDNWLMADVLPFSIQK
jgi:hypothetical protein